MAPRQRDFKDPNVLRIGPEGGHLVFIRANDKIGELLGAQKGGGGELKNVYT